MHYGYDNTARLYKIKQKKSKEIEFSSQKRDLRLLIQEYLNWDSQVHTVTNEANRILGIIRISHNDKSVKNIVQLYKSFV